MMNHKYLEQRIHAVFDDCVSKTTFESIEQQLDLVHQHERTGVVMKKKNMTVLKYAYAAVAACVVLAAGVFGAVHYNRHYAVDSVIDIDVNPSVEIAVNKQDKVLSAEALNEDAQTVLEGMELKGVDLNVAVNAVVGSMVKNGFVVDDTSSILITVQNKNTEKSEKIRKTLKQDVDSVLKEHNVDAKVIHQTTAPAKKTNETAQFAKENHISYGKALFVLNLAKKDDTLVPEELAAMTVKELAALVEEKNIDISDIADVDDDDTIWEIIEDSIEDANEDKSGKVELPEGALTVEQAKAAALAHAQLTEADVKHGRVKLVEDDGAYVYEIEFKTAEAKYEYEIDALTGAVLDEDVEQNDEDEAPKGEGAAPDKTEKPVPPADKEDIAVVAPENAITVEKAKEAALNDAKLTADKVRFIQAKLDEDDGAYVYEIAFISGNVEYEYEIDALTGAVLDKDTEQRVDNKVPADKEKPAKPADDDDDDDKVVAPENVITVEKAKEAALNDAKLTADKVRFIQAKLDEDDGAYVYEIAFISGNVEYEYEIDALTGAVLDAEQEEVEAADVRKEMKKTEPAQNQPADGNAFEEFNPVNGNQQTANQNQQGQQNVPNQIAECA